jgi:hypothetical protein
MLQIGVDSKRNAIFQRSHKKSITMKSEEEENTRFACEMLQPSTRN